MALIVILLCLGLQRFFKVGSHAHQVNWIAPYYRWMSAKIEWVTKGHGLVSLALLIIPVLFVLSLLFTLTYHLLTIVGYFILNSILLWYCMDGRDLKKEPYSAVNPVNLFVLTYRRLFAIIFWFFVFGPIGLALYYMIMELRDYLETTSDPVYADLLQFTIKTQGVLDWVPLRLLGLTYALVGHFSATFKTLKSQFMVGIVNHQNQAAEWGLISLQASENQAPTADEIIELIERALMIWLVVIALLSIAFWLG